MDHHHPQGGSFPPPPTNTNGDQPQQFSYDISNMSDLPPKTILGHRRAHSEILGLPDDISFDSDLGVVGNADGGPSMSDDTEEDLFSMYIDMEKFGATATSGEPSSSAVAVPPPAGEGNFSGRHTRIRHHHSQSMDGSSSMKAELLISGSDGGNFTENKKAISSAKLADLALVDPKRAKRIWANRQSAARSKERKMRYISELERKVQTLQTEATTLSTQLNMLQRDSSGLNAENHDLKMRLTSMEQQGNLQDALNDTLRDEVQRLKIVTGQNIAGAGSMMNFAPPSHGPPGQPFYPNNQAMRLLAAQQFQQMQLQQSNQLLQQQQLQQVQQQTGDLNFRGSLLSPGQGESSSENNYPAND